MARGSKAKATKAAAAKNKKGKQEAKGQAQQESPAEQQLEGAADAAQHVTASRQAVVGLSNLGNTCFFNSSVQLLLACAPLQQLVLQKEGHITRGPLGFALQQAALHAAGRSSTSKGGSNSTYNPQSLLSAVCCHAPVFKGKQQHDAHELMRMLLDGLQTQEQRYRELSRRSASKGLAALQNGTAAANGHSSHANGTPDLATTSSSSSSAASSASPQQQNGALPQGAHATTGSLARSSIGSASASSSTSSSDSSDDDTAASAGDGLDALCNAYLAKPKPASLDGLEGLAEGPAGAAVAAAGSDTEGPPSVASSTAAEGGSADDSSSSSEAAAEPQQNLAPGEAAAAVANGAAAGAAKEAQGGLQHTGTAAVPQLPSTSTAADTSLPNAAAASSSTCCRLCGNGLPAQQQQQYMKGHNPLARKSLLPPEPPKSAGTSSVEAVFGGVLCSRITCTACGYCSISYEPFLDLSLPIPLGSGPEEGLARKGSLLSRLANRTTGKKKAAAAAAAAKDSADSSVDGSNPAAAAADTAAAATAAAEAAAAAAAAATAASEAQGKKTKHKEKRRLQLQATKAAKEAAKLARLAKKRQQEQQDDTSGHSSGRGISGQQPGLPPLPDPTLLEDIPPTNYYTQEQLELMQNFKGAGGGTNQEQEGFSPPPQQQQQQQGSQLQGAADAQQQPAQQQVLPLDRMSDSSSAAGAAAAPGADAVAVSQAGTLSDKASAANGWSEAGSADASPPTATVSCWGGGWVDLQSQRSAHAAPSSVTSSQAQPPPSSSSGFVPSSSDGGAPAGGSDGGSSPKAAASQQQQPRSTLHRRFGSLGNLSALTSGAKGGLSSLFTGRHSRQGSKDRDVLDKLAAAVAANGGSSALAQPQRAQSAGVTSPTTEQRKGGLKGFLLSRAATPPPPRPASALGVVSEAGEAGVGGRAGRTSIPEDAPVDPVSTSTSTGPWEQTGQQGQQPGVLFTPLGVVVDSGVSVTAAGPGVLPGVGSGQAGAGSSTDGPAAAADGVVCGGPGGVQGTARRLQRALSDDAVMRFGSFTRSESGSSGGGSGAGEAQQQQLASAAAATGGDVPQLPAHTNAAGAHANGTLPVSAVGQLAPATSSNPFAAPAVQQQQAQDFLQAMPAQQGQQQEAAAAGVGVPAVPATPAGTDPFAAAAVVSKGDALAVKHCLATFFLREDVSWECPKEKALWKERRQSAASGRLSTDGGIGASADSSGAGAGVGVCAACSQQPQQQGGVAIAAHPRLQQLLEGEEDEEGPVFKQVSFSEREPQVRFVPGNVEQRGTDMAAALAGRRPFCRALTWGGASLLLTAQLGEAPTDGAAAAGRQLTLALKAAGEGGVANAAAARVLPGGKGLLLGAVRLPDLQDLQVCADDCAAMQSHWAQLVLNCMADLVHCEGGIAGLQAMVAGGVQLLSTEDGQPALRPGYVDSSSLEGRWKVRGQLPAADGAAGEDLAAAAAGSSAGLTSLQDTDPAQQQLLAGYWEYPAEDAAAADSAVADADAAAGVERGSGSDGAVSMQAASSGCLSPAASSASAAAVGSPAAANGNSSPGQQQQSCDSACQPWTEDAAAADGGDDMFDMDEEPPQDCLSEQQEQGPQLLQPQGWQGDVLSSAGSSQLGGGKPLRSGSSLGSRDGEDGSTSTSRSVPLFKKVPLAAAAAATAPASESDTVTVTDAGSSVEGGGSSGSKGSSSGVLVQSAPVLVPTAAVAAASQPVNITPLQGSPPADATPADIAPGSIAGRTPPLGSTPGSLRRSSLRRRSSSCSRTAHKSYRIYLPPQVLLLHLKRFQHDGRGRLNKLDTAVKFEFELDLSPFMAGDAPGSSSTAAAAAGGSSGGAGSSSGLQQQYQQQQLAPQESLMYDLVGLVVHMGTMRGGHYVSYVKRVLGPPGQEQAGEGSSNGGSSSGADRVQWYYVSDTSVRAVSVTEVASAQAYMLLYVRRPGKQQQQKEEEEEAAAAAVVPEQEQQQEPTQLHDCGL